MALMFCDHPLVVRGAAITIVAFTLTALVVLYAGTGSLSIFWFSSGPASASSFASRIDFNASKRPVSASFSSPTDFNASNGLVPASDSSASHTDFSASDGPISASPMDFDAAYGSISASHMDFDASGGRFSPSSTFRIDFNASSVPSPTARRQSLEGVLKNAANRDKTVILTTINEAWAAPGSVLELFISSFAMGEGTKKLLKHLVMVALDQNAYARCRKLHKHCYALFTQGTDFHREVLFMTPTYQEMVWRRTKLLLTVLEMGYNFVFTDADILWFRNPFSWFYKDADFQTACDKYLGNAESLRNWPNCGFQYVKSNNRSIDFFKFWYHSRLKYPGALEQAVLNKIKFDPFISNIGLKIKFLHTDYFGGICSPSRDFNKVCTMHTNCCVGEDRKVGDLRLMLEDWSRYKSSSSKKRLRFQWSAQYCRRRKIVSVDKELYRGTKERNKKTRSNHVGEIRGTSSNPTK